MQASSLYPEEDRHGWILAQNHLEETLGQQAYNLGHSEQAILHFAGLLTRAGADFDEASELADESFLDDFRLAWDVLGGRADQMAIHHSVALKDPLFDIATCELEQGSVTAQLDDEWKDLEQRFLATGFSAVHSGSDIPQSLLPRSSGVVAVAGGKHIFG